MASGIKVEGVAQLSAALAKVGRGVHTGAEAATGQTADDMVRTARQRAPVDTGELLESIHAEQDGEHAEVIADAPHAGYAEFGTQTHEPHPFMTPAAELGRLAYPKTVAAEVRGRIT